MSRWISHKPDYHADITIALPHFVTRSCTLLATGYAEVMQNGDGRIPSKNGLDISKFGPVLANLALAAVSRDSTCIFRIAGEGLRNRFSQKLVGTNYYNLVDPARQRYAMQSMDMAVSIPCAFRAELLQKFDNGEERRAETCAFPLRSDEPGIDGFIIFADDEIDRLRPAAAARPVLVNSQVIRRELIDLGFGLDESFEDLVPRKLMSAVPSL